VISFSDETLLPKLGKIPLPPYVRISLPNPERYQTVFAHVAGSVAAPTAGLHFTPELLSQLVGKGVHCLFVTLHVGLDTFRPVREDNPLEHPIHKEYGVLSREVAKGLSQAKAEGRRIICVGTTTVRIVEQTAQEGSPLQIQPFEGWVNLFILPGYQFRMTDALITNFHLPKSTLLMLVTAFAGKEFIKRAYEIAKARHDKLKRERDNRKAQEAMDKFRQALENGKNVMPPLIEAVKAGVTSSEVGNIQREIFGTWKPPLPI